MRLSLRFWVLASTLFLASLGCALAAPTLRSSRVQSFTETVNCFVQCDGPPYNYFMPGMTIAQCCSYVSGNCFGTGYSYGGEPAMVCE